LRKVLFPALMQSAGAGGIQVVGINGGEDHIHALIKLMPAQNIAEVIRQLKEISAGWLNDSRLLQQAFEWDAEYAAYSVSPATIDKSIEYLGRQEAYHQTRSLDEELAAFNKMVAQAI
jgi:REP element-mobilizing transposase RayT